MITIRINIKKHLQEYLIGKFGNDGIVSLPDGCDLYHTLFNLTQKRPLNCPFDTGNLTLALPNRRIGKNPAFYNYLGQRGEHIFEQHVEVMFWAELHDMIDYNKHREGIDYADSVISFMKMYDISSISEDALIKNYYRWRIKIRKRDKKRKYNKS